MLIITRHRGRAEEEQKGERDEVLRSWKGVERGMGRERKRRELGREGRRVGVEVRNIHFQLRISLRNL